MQRSWNKLIWIGFGIILAAALSYNKLFVRFPVTRDFPWANLLLFAVGGGLISAGIRRAFTEPERYRGKISGIALGALSLALCALFCWVCFVFARHLPASAAAPQAGQPAPDFTLPDADGRPVSLAALRQTNRTVLLIFYRGYW